MAFLVRLMHVMPILTIVVLLYLWNTINPSEATPAEILLVFVLLYAFFLSIFFLLARIGFKAYVRIRFNKEENSKLEFKAHKVYYVASVVAFFPVLLLAMQSIGQLKLNDVVLVGVLVGLAVFYVVKRS